MKHVGMNKRGDEEMLHKNGGGGGGGVFTFVTRSDGQTKGQNDDP